MTIREMTPSDGQAAARILLELEWMDWLKDRSVEDLGADLAVRLAEVNARESEIALCAEVDGEMVGYAVVHWLLTMAMPGLEAYLGELFVRSDQRGNGVGTALTDEVVRMAKKRGCFRVRLINGCKSESYKRQFYAKHGFEEREDIRDFCLYL